MHAALVKFCINMRVIVVCLMQKATSSKTKRIFHRIFRQHTQFSVEAEKCSPAFTSKDGSLP